MAPPKSVKLVSSCPEIDFRAKLSKQKFLRTLPQTGINHKMLMLACCIPTLRDLNLENGFLQFSDAHKLVKELIFRFKT
jgi:hypothetical protein